jgi:hypothetical protein
MSSSVNKLMTDCITEQEYLEFKKEIEEQSGVPWVDNERFIYISVKQLKTGINKYLQNLENKKTYDGVQDDLAFFVSGLISFITKGRKINKERYIREIEKIKDYF